MLALKRFSLSRALEQAHSIENTFQSADSATRYELREPREEREREHNNPELAAKLRLNRKQAMAYTSDSSKSLLDKNLFNTEKKVCGLFASCWRCCTRQW